MSLRIQALIIAALVAIVFGAGWTVNGWRLGGQMASIEQQHAERQLAMAEAAKQIGIEANTVISAADTRAWKGLEDDKKELSRLRGCVADRTCGVRLITKYVPADSGGSDSSTSSMGHDAIELDPDIQRRVLDHKQSISEDQRKIEYLQEYSTQCWRGANLSQLNDSR